MRAFVKTITIGHSVVQAGVVDEDPAGEYSTIVIAFTRASSSAPTYGKEGMFERATVAGKAWNRLVHANLSNVAHFNIPCRGVSSVWMWTARKARIKEMFDILDAVPDGARVDLLSVGLDGLTSSAANFASLHERYPALVIRVVVIAPDDFIGTQQAFPQAANSIRYGVFSLSSIVEVQAQAKTTQNDHAAEYLNLLEIVTTRALLNLTIGRANFRASPLSEFASGVDERQWKGTRSLRGSKRLSNEEQKALDPVTTSLEQDQASIDNDEA
ncbi:hypothetical protein MMC25_001754 [Agyrium rufum]|nr:hypothetical protein [Agyrium rufum]